MSTAFWPPVPRVGLGRAPDCTYDACAPVDAPELPGGVAADGATIAVRGALLALGLDAANAGTAAWNPLAELVRPGDRVVLKPNWVLHENRGGYGVPELVTHTAVLRAILRYLVRARPGDIVIGDAPLQGCDFDRLRGIMGIDALLDVPREAGIPARIVDFRRKVLLGHLGDPVVLTPRGDDEYVLYDLGADSLLEPITPEAGRYRVTMYPPDALDRTHRPGQHQYLVAREIVEADVVINVPKLKTHMKAGVTGALKNMVGMNGLKDYLPHHRKGGSDSGGDCYPGRSWLLATAEELLDVANATAIAPVRKALAKVVGALLRVRKATGRSASVEGAWHGNDTVWRMCLDLQRILHYGDRAGGLATVPQRRILHVTDAILAGDKEGPLQVAPVRLGVVSASTHAAAAEWVHAQLMGFDPTRVPLLVGSWALPAPWNFGPATPAAIEVVTDAGERLAGTVPSDWIVDFEPPKGWIGHVEAVRPAPAGRAA